MKNLSNSMLELMEELKPQFAKYSDSQLVALINQKSDFNWDDEGTELTRRRMLNNGRPFTKFVGNTMVIIQQIN